MKLQLDYAPSHQDAIPDIETKGYKPHALVRMHGTV